MKIYLAGSSKELDRVKGIARALERYVIGVFLTAEWWRDVEASPVADHALTVERARMFAAKDLDAVVAADVFWLLAPETQSTGAYVERGYALGYRASSIVPPVCNYRIIVSGADARRCLFTSLADHLFATDEAALGWVQDRTAREFVSAQTESP